MSGAVVPLDADLFAIAILIDELKHTELSCRLNATKKLAQLGAWSVGHTPPRSPLLHPAAAPADAP